MKKARVYSLIAVISIITMLFSTVTSFAFFSADLSRSATVSEAVGAKTTNVTFVSTEFELRAACTDSLFNSPWQVSEASGRKIITLTGDIILSTNMIVTADCAFNLGDYNIDLNGHSMTIRNGYSGVFEILAGAGRITGEGTFAVDLQHMDFDGIEDYLAETVTYSVISYDETTMAGIICDFVGDKILRGDTYGYYYDSIDLPLHYRSFDGIRLEYTSDNPSVLNNAGVVASSTGLNSIVNITLTITFEDTGHTYSHSWPVHIISTDQKRAWAEAEYNIVCELLSPYRGESTDIYYFGDGIVLPGDFEYPLPHSSVSYAVFNDNNGTAGNTCYTSLVTNDMTPPYLIKDFNGNRQYVLNTNVSVESRTAWLRVYSSMNNYEPCGDIKIRVINDLDAANATKAMLKAGLGEEYENQLLNIELESQEDEVYNYTKYELVSSGNITIGGESITPDRFEYSMEEEDSPYEIVWEDDKAILQVKESAWGTLDSDTPDYYLRASFSYGQGISPQIGMEFIKIHFDPNLEQDFYPYYKQLDYGLKQLKTDNSYTYHSFEMPAKMNSKKPYIQYELEAIDRDALNYVSLDESYKPDKVVSNPDDLIRTFNIDTRSLTTEDYRFRLYYWYSFDGLNWSRTNTSGSNKNAQRAAIEKERALTPAEEAELALTLEDYYYTEITIMGIVCDGSYTRAIPDNNLFTAVYATYGGEEYTPAGGSKLRVIPIDNINYLTADLDVNALRKSGVVKGDISNIKGISLLNKAKKINLRNCLSSGMGSSSLIELASMPNVEELDLGENEIGELSNWLVTDTDGLSKMRSLRTLWIDNNEIQRFYNWYRYPALETLYIYGNESTSWIDWFLGLFNKNAQLWGCRGLLNRAVFSLSISNGVDVYNEYANGKYSYIGSDTNDDIMLGVKAADELVYQYQTANSIFDYSGGGSNASRRVNHMYEIFTNTWDEWSWDTWTYIDYYTPASNAFTPMENKNKPATVLISETYQGNNTYTYTITLRKYIQDGNTLILFSTYSYQDLFDKEISVTYTPIGDITYEELPPQLRAPSLLSMLPMPLEAMQMLLDPMMMEMSEEATEIDSLPPADIVEEPAAEAVETETEDVLPDEEPTEPQEVTESGDIVTEDTEVYVGETITDEEVALDEQQTEPEKINNNDDLSGTADDSSDLCLDD